jgi:hypothetical protein
LPRLGDEGHRISGEHLVQQGEKYVPLTVDHVRYWNHGCPTCAFFPLIFRTLCEMWTRDFHYYSHVQWFPILFLGSFCHQMLSGNEKKSAHRAAPVRQVFTGSTWRQPFPAKSRAFQIELAYHMVIICLSYYGYHKMSKYVGCPTPPEKKKTVLIQVLGRFNRCAGCWGHFRLRILRFFWGWVTARCDCVSQLPKLATIAITSVSKIT